MKAPSRGSSKVKARAIVAKNSAPRGVVWTGGRYVDPDRAKVPLLDRGFLFGDGVFEALRTYGRRPFRLSSHLKRLDRSAAALGFTIPATADELTKLVQGGIDRIPGNEVYIRLMATRGVAGFTAALPVESRPTLHALFTALPAPAPKVAQGVTVTTLVEERPARLASVKRLDAVPAMMARREGARRGAYEVLRLDRGGHLIEGFMSNVFLVIEGALVTPPVAAGLLDGVTRATVLEVAASWGIPVQERPVALEALWSSDEVFLSHTSAGVVPVVAVDDRPVGGARVGPLTSRLVDWFASLKNNPYLTEEPR